MNELNKRHTGCQASMDYDQGNSKVNATTSVDKTLMQLYEEVSDSYSAIDEAATLPQPESTATKISINPFTNPFYEFLSFDDPLAHLEMTVQDEYSICADWILKHREFFNLN
ncbi:hypothetical protein HNY73_014381 [Argiope bruennichi]|uniref:Uncharacterized protein n=1 Tax=Argiope bruennichi TaxID=94029 RepID=A0A8T0EP17_ARGBR|nr:hypothetical protein HNY73_014381 [Argiope bruennichi]